MRSSFIHVLFKYCIQYPELSLFASDLHRGQFNQGMLGDEIDANSRPIFPVELDDNLVLEDTKEWVQKG